MTREEFITTLNGYYSELCGDGRPRPVLPKLKVTRLPEEDDRDLLGLQFYSQMSVSDNMKLFGPWLLSVAKKYFENCPCVSVKTGGPMGGKPTIDGKEGWALKVSLNDKDNNLNETSKESCDEGFRNLANMIRRMSDNTDEYERSCQEYNKQNLETVRKYAEMKMKNVVAQTSTKSSLTAGIPTMNNTMTETIKQLLESNLQVILTGAPGTGKTFTARQVAEKIVLAGLPEDAPDEAKEKTKSERIQSVQFHPGYDYSDFVIGMKPVLVSDDGKEVFKDESGQLFTTSNDRKDGDRTPYSGKANVSFQWKDGVFKTFADKAKANPDHNYTSNDRKDGDRTPYSGKANVSFQWKDGVFKTFADKAKANPDHNYVFLIDEINRADLSRVFGELFSLLEEEYRYPNNPKGITLPNGENFVIPKNLYIIGTMNDIDRSVESMDFALRRRFAWYEVKAKDSKAIIGEKVSDEASVVKLESAMDALNDKIASPDLRLGTAYQLGGAIFAKFEKCNRDFNALWNNHISNVLGEYLRGRRDSGDILNALKGIFDNAIGGGGGEQSPEQSLEATPVSAGQQPAPQA